MGRDKALVEVHGVPLAAIVAGALRAAGADTVLAVGGDGPALAGLGLVPVPDEHPGAGPLGGVLTALHRAPTPVVAVLACDLPGARAAGVAAVVEALAARADAEVAVPVVDGRRALAHAAWRRSAAPGVAAAFASGERSLGGALDRLPVVEVPGLDPAWLADADVPEDLPGAGTHVSGAVGPHCAP
jgi:molybdopterin-guanine dinucleotide biosynthesis protein A